MRWFGQLAVIAVLGGAGVGGWHAYKTGELDRLKDVPGLGPIAAKILPARAAAPAPGGPGAGGPPGRGGPPPAVDVDLVKTGRIVESREAVGTVRAFESITVTAKVSGIIQEISFQEGQKVRTGDVLLRFDADERRADIEQSVAEIRRAEALRNETRTRLDRAQALRRSGAGTEAQVEDLSAQVRTLESAITSAEARRRGAEARLDDSVIRAPFAGRLGTRGVSLGAYVSPGTKITTLDDLAKVRLDFAVPENLLGQLQPGLVVHARSAAYPERVFEGTVSVIDPRVDAVTRTARLTAEFPNPDEALKPGMFLSVVLEITTRENAVVAPEEALVSEGLRQLMYVVKDNVVERRVVRLGQRQSGQVEILEGLRAGETLVVRGLQRVRPGITVTPKPINAGPPAAIPDAPGPNTLSLPPAAVPTSAAPARPAASQAPAKALAAGRRS